MVRTYGLTHLALRVRDPAKSARFYGAVVGSKVAYQSSDFVQVQTPGSRDVLVFERGRSGAGRSGGIAHFGFRLRRPSDIDKAVEAVVQAGGVLIKTGEFVPGEPYLFARDLDGYEFEIWFELPTPVDPRPNRRAKRKPKLQPRPK